MRLGKICKPYPDYRLPGWNRLSAGLHLDNMQKFYEGDQGGQAYDLDKRLPIPLLTGKGKSHHHHHLPVIGCGYEFSSKSLFYTYDGVRLGAAFRGVYVPREGHDVYAAIRVSGPVANALSVNFCGRDLCGRRRMKRSGG